MIFKNRIYYRWIINFTMYSAIVCILSLQFLLFSSFIRCDNKYSLPMIYTVEGQSVTGKWCLNDCIDGRCVVDIDTVENCHRTNNSAPTYYTTGQNYYDNYKCTSRCKVLKGDNRNRCYIQYDWSKLDYCNPDFTKTFEYRDFTFENGPCANDCRPKKGSDASTGECNDNAGVLRSCYIEKFLYESVITTSGHKCNGECLRHQDKSYSWCYYSKSSWDYCARPALYNNVCFKCKSPIREKRNIENQETVSQYAERMERDPRLKTVRMNNPNNPIYSYTYNETMTPNGPVRLPLVVRARIYRSHIQPKNSRGNNAISSGAKTNCRRMGMVGGDAFGHLVAYKLGGPSDFYNFVPMTQSINIGSVSNGEIYAPSVWTASERETSHFVEHYDGQVHLTVVLRYNLNDPNYPYRPIRIGTGSWQRAANGDPILSCSSYWYNNEVGILDPECFD